MFIDGDNCLCKDKFTWMSRDDILNSDDHEEIKDGFMYYSPDLDGEC